MEVEACDELETASSLEEMLIALEKGYLDNKRLMERLEQMLCMSKLPAGIRHFAAVAGEYFNDVMQSVLDMVGMVVELIKEYAQLIHVQYGLSMEKELRSVRQIFLLLGPHKYQPYIGMVLKDSCRIVAASSSGRRTLSTDYASNLIRSNLYLIKITMRGCLGDARRAKRKLKKEIAYLECNWYALSSLYWKTVKETFEEVL